ncbi:tyrosinase-like [Lissotriton helveticus]
MRAAALPRVPKGSGRRPRAILLCFTLLTFCLITTTRTQFHPDCCTQAALRNRRCCPVSTDGSVCGNLTGRGSCQRHQLRDPKITDTRCNWPYQVYNEICSCKGNYNGADCGDCKPYYHGPTCSEYIPCVRKALHELTAAEKKQFINTLYLAKTTPSTRCVVQTGGELGHVDTYTFQPTSEYDCLVAFHANSAMYISIGGQRIDKDLLHYGPAFCTGHRYLLIQFEHMLQKLSGNKSFCLPYWDWTKDGDTCGVFTDDLMGRVGPNGTILAPSCFADWKIACGNSNDYSFCQQDDDASQRAPLRRDPAATNQWPTAAEVKDTLKWPVYDRHPFNEMSPECFRSTLEGFMDAATGRDHGAYMHRKVHKAIGGAMNQVTLASNDPIFYCHHAQLDRIYAMWQRIHCKTPADYPENNYPCQGPNDVVYPSMPPVVQKIFMNLPEYFGYSYSDQNHWPASKCRNSSRVPECGRAVYH